MKVNKKIILDAAISLISQSGYYAISIQDIAKKAGISVGSIYSYYKSKQEILSAIYENISNQQFMVTNQILKFDNYDPIHKLYATTAGMIWSYSKKPELTIILYVKTLGIDPEIENTYFSIYNRAANNISEMIEAFQKLKLCNITNSKYAACAFLKVLEGMTVQWIRDGQKLPVENLAIQVIEYNCNALQIKYDFDEMNSFVKDIFEKQLFERMEEK